MYAWGICKPSKSVADWSSPLLGTYSWSVRKGQRPEICTSLTVLAICNRDRGYSGHKVTNSAILTYYISDEKECVSLSIGMN